MNTKQFWHKYLLYHGKWQVGSLYAMPMLYLLFDVLGLNAIISTLIFNFCGALIFFPIDNWIFQKQNNGKEDKTNNNA